MGVQVGDVGVQVGDAGCNCPNASSLSHPIDPEMFLHTVLDTRNARNLYLNVWVTAVCKDNSCYNN